MKWTFSVIAVANAELVLRPKSTKDSVKPNVLLIAVGLKSRTAEGEHILSKIEL